MGSECKVIHDKHGCVNKRGQDAPVSHWGGWRQGKRGQSAAVAPTRELGGGVKGRQRQPLPRVHIDHGKIHHGPAAAHAAGYQHDGCRAGGVAADASYAGSVVASRRCRAASLQRNTPGRLARENVVGVQGEEPVALVLVTACFKPLRNRVVHT
jgi:hypothetical protein